MSEEADVLIVGGGLVGSSIAFNLIHDGFSGRVVVIERDPSYMFASSALAMGGVRQQFLSRINVDMVRYSVRVYASWIPCDFRRRGYLFLGTGANWEKLTRRYEVQKSLGAAVELLDVGSTRTMVPELQTDDLVGAMFGPEDGYLDARKALRAFRGEAEQAGAIYVSDEVLGIEIEQQRIRAVHTRKSGRIETLRLVIAAGAYSAALGAMAGIELPITPVRQQLFRCALSRPWSYEFPMTVDPGGAHWRSDGSDAIIVAKTRPDEPTGFRFGCDIERFYEDFLPDLVRRIPEFSALRLLFGWGGLYEMTPDHNAVLGGHPELDGLYIAAGFSGHGLMMAPATGKVMSECIRTGRFETVDVSPLSVDRFERGNLLVDEAMI